MAGQTGLSTFDIETELLEKGRHFSFFQVIRLMRLLGHVPETFEDPQTFARQVQNLQIRPQNDLSFPASDVMSIQRAKEKSRVSWSMRVFSEFTGRRRLCRHSTRKI
jgi:predicted component of type VI protein secretion system